MDEYGRESESRNHRTMRLVGELDYPAIRIRKRFKLCMLDEGRILRNKTYTIVNRSMDDIVFTTKGKSGSFAVFKLNSGDSWPGVKDNVIFALKKQGIIGPGMIEVKEPSSWKEDGF